MAEFGDRDYEPLRRKKAKALKPLEPQNSHKLGPRFFHEKIIKAVYKKPEVMVKITGGGKDSGTIGAHISYISRGDFTLEDQDGRLIESKAEIAELKKHWATSGFGLPEEGQGYRREAINVLLSMPPGTDRAAVKASARDFASQEFEGFQYVFAAHTDTEHPHVHLVVKAVSIDGRKLNPRKADLQRWRDTFAEKLGDHGVEANSTQRWIRGKVQKADRSVAGYINRDKKRGFNSKTKAAQHSDAVTEAIKGSKRENPLKSRIDSSRKKAYRIYGDLAKTLAAGNKDAQQLALKITDFVRSMPPTTKTRHSDLVEAALKVKNKNKTRSHEPKDQSLGR